MVAVIWNNWGYQSQLKQDFKVTQNLPKSMGFYRKDRETFLPWSSLYRKFLSAALSMDWKLYIR